MVDCTPCPKLYSGKCSDCPDHQAELAEYYRKIENHIRSIISLSDEGVAS